MKFSVFQRGTISGQRYDGRTGSPELFWPELLIDVFRKNRKIKNNGSSTLALLIESHDLLWQRNKWSLRTRSCPRPRNSSRPWMSIQSDASPIHPCRVRPLQVVETRSGIDSRTKFIFKQIQGVPPQNFFFLSGSQVCKINPSTLHGSKVQG
jgi:hypothetical protein